MAPDRLIARRKSLLCRGWPGLESSDPPAVATPRLPFRSATAPQHRLFGNALRGNAFLLAGVPAMALFVAAIAFHAAPSAEPPTKAAAAGEKAPQKVADEPDDDLPPNAACCVCHMQFVREEISRVHAEAKVPCIKCHGLSAAHANDENIGATPPDHVYQRHQVDAQCGRCHAEHNVPARDVVARWLDRKLDPQQQPVCTDCHGQHRIAAAEEGAAMPLLGPSL